MVEAMRSGPLVIGYDGSPTSERALLDSAELTAPRPVVVVSVWEPGLAFEVTPPPFEPVPIDIRTALEVDEEVYEHAQRTAEHGVELLRKQGFDAQGVAVADDTTVAATLVRIASEHDAAAIAVGTHSRGVLREALLGSTANAVVRLAPCPVIVVREHEEGNR
jgi:nucleotide-binding universal stress UspA family protein